MSKNSPCERRTRFPISVKRGSVVVKIYRLKHAQSKSGFIYSASWYVGSVRKTKQLVDLAKLEDFAKLKAEQLAAGRIDGSAATVEDVEELNLARELAQPLPLLAALREWSTARNICGGHLVPAAQAYAEKVKPSFESVLVAVACRKLIELKQAAGFKTSNSLEPVLKNFCASYGELPLNSLRQQELQRWLNAVKHPATRNSYRKRIVTLFRWAREAGYLPRDIQTEAERTERAREEAPEVGIIDAKTYLAALLYIQEKHPHYLAPLVLAGFCGLRRIEIHGQLWEHIELERKFVRVTTAKRGTPARRLVPLCEAAVVWLNFVAQPAGAVSPGNTWALDRIRDILKTAGFTLPSNCFRHTYISAAVAKSGDVNQTSLDAGNSPKVIHRHYRELLSAEEGREFFEIYPDGIRPPREENDKMKVSNEK
jgi:integrase